MDTMTTEAALWEEAAKIHGVGRQEKHGEPPAPIYPALNGLNSAALCLSGGGIRSAAFALGVIQALATHPRGARNPEGAATVEPVDSAENSLLSKFHYLSTVSGGGYIGSWLSAWRLVSPFSEVWANLVSRPRDVDREAPPLAWLRSYSNYITPKIGFGSLDTWTVATLWLRNLLLNWIVILPAISGAVLVVKLVGLMSTWVILWDNPSPGPLVAHQEGAYVLLKQQLEGAFGILAIPCLLWAVILTTRSRPIFRKERYAGPDQTRFFWGPMLWSLVAALALVQALASDLAGNFFLECDRAPGDWLCTRHPFDRIGASPEAMGSVYTYLAVGALGGAIIYALGCLPSLRRRSDIIPGCKWALSGTVYGALVALGLHTYLIIPDSGVGNLPVYFIHFVFGVPWILLSQILADMVFVGFSSRYSYSEEDREWSARAYGCLAVLAAVWLVGTFLVFFGSLVAPVFGTEAANKLKAIIPTIGGVAGVVTALFGKSIGARPDTNWWVAYARRALFPVAAIVFAGTLVIIISYLLDQLMFGQNLMPTQPARPLFESIFSKWIPDDLTPAAFRASKDAILRAFAWPIVKFFGLDAFSWTQRFGLLVCALGVAALIIVIGSRSININRFSLHALYRNRLVRAFLGAARERSPDPFDGFDARDNPPMHRLLKPFDGDTRLFPVINAAVNVVSSARLAWQERKAEPFTFSPLHCGSSYLGYRSSRQYGGRRGISLGTAMAISGAAVSPNMGYHSSPAVTFLLSMFNVRLGWWLGNPGEKGDKTYWSEGPPFAIRPFIDEAMGWTTDNREYIYLSDGGHFDNLGIYEMVRRRCRVIVVSDAAYDPSVSLSDLGSSLRKISIDLGVRITFHGLDKLKKRPDEGAPPDPTQQYHAVGEIHYRAADRAGEDGLILYIKAGYRGTEGATIRAYANENPDFPSQSTVDQWFTESQFESYRALGFEITDSVLSTALADSQCAQNPTLENILQALKRRAKGPGALTPAPQL